MQPTRKAPAEAARTAPRRAWVSPEVKDLPRLTDLTLQSGGLIECGVPGSDGSTVCP